MNCSSVPILLGGLLLASSLAEAASTNAASSTTAKTSYFERLRSDDPNYFVFALPNDNGELKGDEEHIEFYLSICYPLVNTAHPWFTGVPNRLMLVYNGLYDFYMIPGERYDSAPVISRRQNPGAAIEWDIGTSSQLRLGYFHESNGQTLDEDDGITAFNRERAQEGLDYALGQVSRGWDYVVLRGKHEYGEAWKLMAQVELRQYLHRQGFGTTAKEDAIFWDPANDSKIQDYDGLRVTYEQHYPRTWLLGDSFVRLELKTGTSDWDSVGNIGGKASLTFHTFWNVFYFKGYGKEPSSYHLESQYAGFGFEFR